jgi:Ca-activated chloride channel homolog
MRRLAEICKKLFTVLGIFSLLFIPCIACAQTTNAINVLKQEMLHSVRNWEHLPGIPLTTTYDQIELNSCTLSFVQKTLPNKKNFSGAFAQIYKYIFPLHTLDVGLEWLDTYNSYVVSLSGPGSIINIKSPIPKYLSGDKSAAPNVFIPFFNEDHAKRAETALQNAIATCAGEKAPIQSVPAPSRQNMENSTPDANNQQFKVKANVDLVTTDVTVTGDNAPELRADDFVIYDNGIAQQISHFSHDRLPVSIAFVLPPFSNGLYWNGPIAAISALRALNPGDLVSIYSENGDRLCNLTDDRVRAAKLFSFIADEMEFDLNIYGTIYDAARYLKQASSGRRAIILVSDNCHLSGFDWTNIDCDQITSVWKELAASLDKVADKSRMELLETSTTLYDVVSWDGHKYDKTPLRANACPGTSEKIKAMAEETGGEVFIAQELTLMKSALETAILKIRNQYTLGFTPSNRGEEGSFHKLTVKLADQGQCPTCRIRARSGYYAGVSQPALPLAKSEPKSMAFSPEIDNELIKQIMRIAGYRLFDYDEISFELRNVEKTAGLNGESQLKIDLSINAAGIDSKAFDGKRAYGMRAAIFYSDKKGNLLGANSWKIEGSPDDEGYKRIMEKGIPFSAIIPLKDKDQIFKIVIYDEKSGRIGSKLAKKHGKDFVLDPHPSPTPGPPSPAVSGCSKN